MGIKRLSPTVAVGCAAVLFCAFFSSAPTPIRHRHGLARCATQRRGRARRDVTLRNTRGTPSRPDCEDGSYQFFHVKLRLPGLVRGAGSPWRAPRVSSWRSTPGSESTWRCAPAGDRDVRIAAAAQLSRPIERPRQVNAEHIVHRRSTAAPTRLALLTPRAIRLSTPGLGGPRRPSTSTAAHYSILRPRRDRQQRLRTINQGFSNQVVRPLPRCRRVQGQTNNVSADSRAGRGVITPRSAADHRVSRLVLQLPAQTSLNAFVFFKPTPARSRAHP